MLVLHVYITGKHGNVERTYDFLRNDGKEELEGLDIVIPYESELRYPLTEYEAINYIKNTDKGDH